MSDSYCQKHGYRDRCEYDRALYEYRYGYYSRGDILRRSHPERFDPEGGNIFPRYSKYAPERVPPVEQRDSGTRGKESRG